MSLFMIIGWCRLLYILSRRGILDSSLERKDAPFSHWWAARLVLTVGVVDATYDPC